jgi:hypothetical protein
MAYKLILNNPTPSAVPTDGWIVGYKPLGSGGSYTVVGPFMSMPIEIVTGDAVGTLYEGYIKRDCEVAQSTDYFWQTPCGCVGTGYVASPSGISCEKVETTAPTVTNSGYCLAPSLQNVYSEFGSRIYTTTPVTTANILEDPATINGDIFAFMNTPVIWRNDGSEPGGLESSGPMNRESVWIDSNCDGTRNDLTNGAQTTIAYMYNNTTQQNKTLYVGVGADNQISLVVNGVQLVDTGTASSDRQFKIWHLVPFTAVPGPNYINLIGTGDGTQQDAMAMIVYENTAAQLRDATLESQLTIRFRSSSLRFTSYDVATCPADYSMDTSGGQGNYTCVKTLYKSCNTLT